MPFSDRLPFSFDTNGFTIRVISTFGSKLVNLALITIANIIIARQLGPAGKGIVTISVLVPSLLATLCHLGIGSANTYYGSKNALLLRALFSNSLIYGILLSVVIAFPYFLFMPLYASILGTNLDRHYLMICFCLFPLNMIWGYMGSIMLAKQKIHELAVGRVAHNLIYLTFVIVAIDVLKYNAAAVLVAMLVAYTGEMLWDLYILRKHTIVGIQIDIPLFKKQIIFGMKNYITNLLDFVNNRFDIFIVNYFLSISAAGIYSISVMLAELIFYIPSSASTVLFPVVAAGNKDNANNFTPLVCRHTFIWCLISGVILAVIAKPLIAFLFSSRFDDSVVPLWLLLPGIIALSINRVISNDLMGRGKPVLGAYSTGIAAFCTIVLDIILIPLWGISGAALASSFAYLVSTTVVICFFLRESGCGLRELFVPNKDDFRFYISHLKTLLG